MQRIGILAGLALAAGAWAAQAQNNTTNIISSYEDVGRGAYVCGDNGSGNVLIITNGGNVNSFTGFIGKSGQAHSNTVIVTGAGSVWNDTTGFDIGDRSSGNSLILTNGGKLNCTAGYLGYYNGANNNAAVVTGAGSLWNVGEGLFVGNGGTGNSLTIANGGAVYSGEAATVGPGPNNSASIIGTGSVWTANGGLAIGGAAGSRLTLDGGSVAGMTLVKGGSTLAGVGTLGGLTLEKDATLSPGNPAGRLVVTGNLTLNSGTKLNFALGSAKEAGADYAQVAVQGTLDLGGVGFDNFTFTTRGGFGPGVFKLMTGATLAGNLGATTGGTVGGKKAVLSKEDKSLVLTVSP